jgi:hypothetical protein
VDEQNQQNLNDVEYCLPCIQSENFFFSTENM